MMVLIPLIERIYLMGKVIGKTRCPSCAAKGADRHGDNLIKYADGGSHCFSCGYWSKGMVGISNRLVQRPEPTTSSGRGLTLPEDIETLNPAHAGYHWITEYLDKVPVGLLWSSNHQWMIFPIVIGGDMVAWQARNFSGVGAKWLTFGSVTDILYILGKGDPILVEDIISAIKIQQAGGCAIPLFGCTIGSKRFQMLYNRFERVSLWLDPDKRKETIQEARKAFRIGLHMRSLLSDADPKEHTIDYIKEIIGTSS